MFKLSLPTRLALHVANLAVIVVILLPLAAVLIGSIQSEKSLQADTRRVLPAEYTLDNFTLILSGGAQKGRIFEQATYLPENIKQELRRGAMIFDAKHVRLDRGFTGDWETIELKR